MTPGQRPRLTLQQLRIIGLVSKGRTDKQIAESLGLSAATVQRRLREAAQELRVESRVAVAVRCARLGLIGTDDAPVVEPDQDPGHG